MTLDRIAYEVSTLLMVVGLLTVAYLAWRWAR